MYLYGSSSQESPPLNFYPNSSEIISLARLDPWSMLDLHCVFEIPILAIAQDLNLQLLKTTALAAQHVQVESQALWL